MRTIIFLVFAFLYLGKAFAAKDAFYEKPEDLKKLADFYSAKSNGAIFLKPNFASINENFIAQYGDFSWRIYSSPLLGDPRAERTQDLFGIDVDRYVKSVNAANFLDAKRKYYKKLDFDPVRQQYDRPYMYLSSWTSLFHPPVKKLTLPLSHYSSLFTDSPPENSSSPFFDENFQIKLDHLNQTDLTFGNDLELLANDKSYGEKMRLIKSAKKYVYAAVMAFYCDPSTKEIIHALAQRKQEGLDIKIITDGTFDELNGDCSELMTSQGLDVLEINDSTKLASLTRMMHHKFWIKDGEEGIMGGMNMIYVDNTSTGFNNMNRDSDVLIKSGAAVTDLTNSFMKLWTRKMDPEVNARIPSAFIDELQRKYFLQKSNHERGIENYAEGLNDPVRRMNGVCRVMVQTENAGDQAIFPVIYNYVGAATKQILFTSPDLSYDNDKSGVHNNSRLMHLVDDVARTKGVDVDIISNGYEGGFGEASHLMEDAERGAGKLLSSNIERVRVKIDMNMSKQNREKLLLLAKNPHIQTWTYMNYIHAKQYLFDGIAGFIGSFNIESHSAEVNYESGILCLDGKLSRELAEQLTLDLVNSVPVVSKNNL